MRHPVREISFSVVDPGIHVANIKLGGFGRGCCRPLRDPARGRDLPCVADQLYGNTHLSLGSFASSTKLHAGDLASHAALLATLAPIDAAYRRLGYMDVVVQAMPTLDAAAHTVVYQVQVQPGEIYRVQTLTADNLTPAAHADFDRTFRMKAGELYNPEYPAGYLKSNKSLHSLDNYFATFKAYADPNSHTVDLVMTFARMKEQ